MIGGMKMRRILVLAVLAALAGCGSAQATSPATASGYAAGAANPVPILRLTGYPVPASERYGTIGLDDDRGALRRQMEPYIQGHEALRRQMEPYIQGFEALRRQVEPIAQAAEQFVRHAG